MGPAEAEDDGDLPPGHEAQGGLCRLDAAGRMADAERHLGRLPVQQRLLDLGQERWHVLRVHEL